jgi:hypothetical protein
MSQISVSVGLSSGSGAVVARRGRQLVAKRVSTWARSSFLTGLLM